MLHTRAAVFLPAALPRDGRVAFWSPDGLPPPGGDGTPGVSGEITVVRQHGAGVRGRTVPAVLLSVAEAVPLLARARHDAAAHPATASWGAAALHALHLAARGRLLPGLTPTDHDAWRAGPLDADDIAHLRAIAAAMPYEAHATPLPGPRPLRLPEPEALIRSFLDAVADTLPRTPAAEHAAGRPFAATAPQHLPGAREWAAEAAAGMDAGVRISLRLDLSAYELFDLGEEGGDERQAGAALVQVHSLADPTVILDAARLWAGEGDDHFGPRARIDAVLALRRAARVWPPLGRLMERDVPDVLPLTEDELYELLGEAAARLGAAGVAVHWPRELARTLSAAAVVRSPAPGSATDGTPFFDSEQLLRFNWQLALDGDPLTEREMDALAESHRPVVRLRDQWVVVDPDLVRKARKRELGLLGPVDALAVALTGTAEVDGETVEAVPEGALAALRDRLTEGPAVLARPTGLDATLRDYQLRGLAWLDLMTSLGLGGCLADDMGLGKTVTVIALHLHRAEHRGRTAPTLVVCPASLLGNWQREITRFAPGVPVRRFHGQERDLDTGPGGFVLTTYGTMRTSAEDLAAREWDMVVADEAQHVKNPFSATARALRTIPAPARVALTGTPVENNLSELWSLLDWTTPGLLGPLKSFRARHARAVENNEHVENEEAVERLSRLVRPFLLRRKKSDPGIVPELPPKTESDHPVPLTREQASLYEAVVRETMAQIETAEGIARRGLIMKLLTSLKQICNHPAQYLKEDGARLTARSGKLALLDELLGTILAEDGSVLVFTQYVSMARLISAHLTSRAIPSQLLHGATPVPERDRMVDRFQSGEVPVFILSLKAAGTGLNLTRAGHVVHYDRWWNPAVEDQATDRAYRIGQTQPVQVHRLIAEGTVEDRIAEMLLAKRALADAVLGSGEAALTELTDRELADLVSLRRPS
ncbi:DEAD/DEAH box helicase [Streptomyces sp. NBC_01619]|uniref:DEAD/DEAH box helicase n=1 Tax=Streptomyces sp. NBC_01619 TaxID=2975901 RepID=UPI002259DDC8|nr:DEAD/DEAH box helicase [Streptomyces sp. NBC_01619]MCX4509736.1 DEAD/DEAH box helicase [Streptomyces sp. NBC_01619]